MKSRKLRALALVLSAIMIITAVPSTLFAEDFVGEVDGWDDTEIAEAEAPAEAAVDFGFDAEVEVAPLVAEEVDFFAADELVAAENGIEKETWNFAKQTVTIKTKGDEPDVTYKATVEQSKSDCTKVYMMATIKDINGNDLVIYSNIPSKNWTVNDGTSDATNGEKPDPDFGLYPSGKTHTWNSGTVTDATYSCVEQDKNKYKLVYKCDVCGTYGYKAEGATAVTAAVDYETARANAPFINLPITGKHTRPDDASKVKKTVTYLYEEATDLDGTTFTPQNVEPNATNDLTKVPKITDPTADAVWIVKTVYEYTCAICGEKVTAEDETDYELAYDGKYIRKIAYAVAADANIAVNNLEKVPESELEAERFNLPATTKIYDGTKWEDDSKYFEVADCAKGKGVYTELWYTASYEATTGENTYKVSREISHEVEPHSNTIKIYRTSAVAVGSYENKDAIADGLSSIQKICAVTTDDDGNPVVLGSLSCKDVTYYEILVCNNVCDKYNGKYKTVLSCTKKTAVGNEKAHKYNEDASAVAELDVKATHKYKTLTDLVEKGGVVFKNATFTCVTDGTVDAYYTCPVCGKELFLNTYKIEQTGHVWEWVDIEPKKDATCTEDGFVTQQSQCKVCQTVNTALGTRVATIPLLGHKFGSQKYKLKVNQTGTIIGNNEFATFANKPLAMNAKMLHPQGEAEDKHSNEDEIGAVLYKTCTRCGKDIASKDIESSANVKKVDKYEIIAISPSDTSCYGGQITIKVTAYAATAGTDDDLTETATYDYWKNMTSYQARTQHAPKENADGSIVCVICGKVIKEAPVVTTVAPTTVEPTTVVTTEAPTTVAPTTVAPTTTAPTTTAPTTEAPVVPTTVAPVTVEPTTEITTVEPATMPAQVTGEKVTKVSPAKGIIGVKYNAVDGADSYTVNVREPNGAWKKNPTDGAETAYEITGLTEGKCYDIRIAAIAAGIAGPRSGHLYRWLKKVTLMKPTKIKAEAGAVNVTWDAADGASKYKLYVSSDKTFKTDVKKFKVTENTAKVTGLTVGTKYYFKVRCYTKGADGITYTGGWSNVKSKTLK